MTILNATPDEAVVVRVADGWSVQDGEVRSGTAATTGPVVRLGSGLHELSVPAYGSVTLAVVTAAS